MKKVHYFHIVIHINSIIYIQFVCKPRTHSVILHIVHYFICNKERINRRTHHFTKEYDRTEMIGLPGGQSPRKGGRSPHDFEQGPIADGRANPRVGRQGLR